MSEFEDLTSALDRPVIVVTTGSGRDRSGCLVGFHTPCGISPPMYAVWLSKANHTYRIGSFTDTFAVHFLRADQHDLAELFGEDTGDEVDKFERCEWTPGPDGVPLLDDCHDRFTGRRVAWLDAGGDHVCVLLEPIDAEASGQRHWLTLEAVSDLDAGNPAEERQQPS